MERLSGLDAFFLYMETPSQPLNVCCVLELDTSTMPGGYTYGRFHAALEKYVKAAPEFRMKLADTELNLDHPVWVDDDNFQIRHHLRRVAMPAPGGRRELAEICGYIAGLPLDRDRPLWEMWVIEGGARSDTVAVMLKVHHAVVDGVAGEPAVPPVQPAARCAGTATCPGHRWRQCAADSCEWAGGVRVAASAAGDGGTGDSAHIGAHIAACP